MKSQYWQSNPNYTYFYKKLRIWATTESFLKSSDFEYSEFPKSFFKIP